MTLLAASLVARITACERMGSRSANWQTASRRERTMPSIRQSLGTVKLQAGTAMFPPSGESVGRALRMCGIIVQARIHASSPCGLRLSVRLLLDIHLQASRDLEVWPQIDQ